MSIDQVQPNLREGREFAYRALMDFGLMEAFEARSPIEREASLAWLDRASSMAEQERGVTKLLRLLGQGSPLPSGEEAMRVETGAMCVLSSARRHRPGCTRAS
jgi:hypothetical protein